MDWSCQSIYDWIFLFRLTLALLQLNPNHKYAGSNILSKDLFLCLLSTKNGVSHLSMGVHWGGGRRALAPQIPKYVILEDFFKAWDAFQAIIFWEVFAPPPNPIKSNKLPPRKTSYEHPVIQTFFVEEKERKLFIIYRPVKSHA